MPKFDLAMLDFDGTLADSAASIVHCLKRTFEVQGEKPPGEKAIRDTIGIPLAMAIVHLRRKGRRTDGEAWAHKYREIFKVEGPARFRLFEGAEELLAGLAGRGTAIAIVSARKAHVTQALLDNLGLSQYVQAVYGDTPGGPNKPDPRLYSELILPRFDGAGPLRSIMVGDTHIDLEFAKASGTASCWVSHGYGDPARCRALQPDFQAACLQEVLELF